MNEYEELIALIEEEVRVFSDRQCALLLEALRAVPQWIPVVDKSASKIGDEFLVTNGKHRQTATTLWNSIAYYYGKQVLTGVTHYAELIPLPTPPAAKPNPKEENSNG